MQRVVRRWKIAAIISAILIAGWSAHADAQLPICPEPAPDQPVYTACLPGGRFLVVPLLTSFTIDQLLKADGAPIVREPGAVFASTVSEETREKNGALADYLDLLEPVKFTRIDTATGTLRQDVGEGERSFATTILVGEAAYSLGLQLPDRLEGGYWRTPGVVQMAFWKGQRASFTLKSADGAEIASEIDCVVISGDGVRLTTSAPSFPDIVVRFDSCE